jgi:hypothetical protein
MNFRAQAKKFLCLCENLFEKLASVENTQLILELYL